MADYKLKEPTANEAILLHQLEETKADVANMKTQLGDVKNDFSKLNSKVDGLSVDVKGLSREIIDSNARTDVYNRQAHEASSEMLSMLKAQLSYYTTSEVTRDEFARAQRQNLWKTLGIAVGSGGFISILVAQLFGG